VKAVAAVLFVALSLSAAAQQQRSNSQPSWPCGARIDSSYFRMAEGSGGHLLLLAPEEIGDSAALVIALGAHPQTLFRLAGSVTPGLHEFNVAIDSSVESVLFSISVQCLQTADVVRPSGALAVGDDVTLLPNFRAQHVVIVKRPEAGTWTLRVAGTGVSGVVVQAQTALAMGSVDFKPLSGTTFTPSPSAGVENAVRIHINGGALDLRGSVVNGLFQLLADLPLAPGDTEGSYVSRIIPSEPFRILVTGKDANGSVFQRMSAPLVTPAR
jgi:hypothetical protein